MSETRIEGFPLSPQQRDLWLLQDSGGAGPYRCQGLVWINGPLEADRLRSALAWTIDRNEILRTVFLSLAEVRTPLQAVLEPGDPDLLVLDLEGSHSDAREKKIAALWDEILTAPLDFERGPLFRTALIRLTAGEHLLLLGLPSLCADAAGLDNLVAEIRACYAALAAPGEEPGEPLQYVDLAEWQNGVLAAEDGQEGVEIWRRRLLTLPAATLPFEHGGASEFAPRSVSVKLDKGAGADLLLTAWLVLLRRLSGQADLGIGVACDGRNYAELTSAPGLFARFLPVTTLVGDAIPFSSLQREIAASLAEARQWQQCFSWDLLAEPDAAGRPWFPFCFEAETAAANAEPAAGVIFSLARRSACTDRFHLKLLWQAAEGRAEIHYDPAHFETDDVERLADQLAALAESALAAPDMPARDLDALSAVERRELLVRFNDNPPLAPADAGTVYELFTRWAERTPDTDAVICEDERLTYRELARRARHLAGTLQRLGVGPEVPVGLLVDRSVEMVVGLLGILGSGGAYVPLDPTLPAERLAFLLADSRPALLVTGGQPLRGLPEPLPPVVPMSAEGMEERPSPRAQGENLAYVIYTSGSTGRPKGVAVEHRQLLNYVLGILERAPLPPGSRFATVSTLAADLGNTSVFGALCGGGTLHVIAAERASHPEALGQYFSRHGIDSLKIVPSHLRALLQGSAPERVLPRRQLILGGEPCAWDLVERVRALALGCRVINHYGPTETTVGVLTHAVESERPAGAAALTLDRPLAGSQVYLLGPGLRPVPRWMAGEVHIAGAGLARGYLNRPDLTAERFIPDPVSGEPGSRLYRTGDLARHLSGGGLEILGRMDDQVKIRGFRIEPGEVEAALRDHPAVLAAAVLARGEGDDKRLVAYVVPRPEAEPAAGDLRRHLAVRLPEAMIPADFVQLAALPLTANGKLDRQALPAPEEAPAASGPLSAPRTPAEELLVGIWCEVLKRDAVGVHDDFFELGGHSLLVAQIVSRIRDCFGVEIALRDLFEEPTVAGLAGRVEAAGLTAGRPEAPPLERAARDGGLPLSFSQRRLWFFDQLEPGSAFYNIFVPVLLSGPLDAATLASALTGVVRRHEMLRTTFASADGEPLQVPGPARPQDLPVADLSGLEGTARDAEAERLATEEARLPFDLARGPLLRTRLVRLGEDRHLALLSMHHIASDAWSMGILVREIVALYEAAMEGRPSPLPELPVQYADFALWQTRWLSGDHLESELSYWRRQLAGAPPALDLPTDWPRPPVLTFRGGRESLQLPKALCDALRRLSRRQGATLFMTFLAAFAVQLRHASGRADVVVGTNVANRDRLETEGLVGFFVNQLVLRTDLSGDPEFAEILSRVRATALGAYEHQHVPFERLVEELQPPRDRSRSLLYQHKIEYADGERDAFELPSLRVEPYSFANPPARYDLHLTLSNAGRDIRAALLYNADLFAAPTAVRFLEDFRNLLETVSVDPHLKLGKLEEGLSSLDRQRRAADEEEYAGALRQKLKSVRRLAVSG